MIYIFEALDIKPGLQIRTIQTKERYLIVKTSGGWLSLVKIFKGEVLKEGLTPFDMANYINSFNDDGQMRFEPIPN